jgi:aerobic carbon-monoxide dehydrogenase medium subunit
MIPIYRAPENLHEALELLSRFGRDAIVLAGGQAVIPELRRMPVLPHAIVDLRRIGELNFIAVADSVLRIGSMVTCDQLEHAPPVQASLPILSEVAALIASRPIRIRATLGGNLAQADGKTEFCATAILLGAHVFVARAGGEPVRIAAAKFIGNGGRLSLMPDQLVVGAEFPLLPASFGWAVSKFSYHPHEHSLLFVGIMARMQGGAMKEARIALTGLRDQAVIATELEQYLIGKVVRELDQVEMASLLPEPLERAGVSSDYVRHAAAVLTRRTLIKAIERSGVSDGAP